MPKSSGATDDGSARWRTLGSCKMLQYLIQSVRGPTDPGCRLIGTAVRTGTGTTCRWYREREPTAIRQVAHGAEGRCRSWVGGQHGCEGLSAARARWAHRNTGPPGNLRSRTTFRGRGPQRYGQLKTSWKIWVNSESETRRRWRSCSESSAEHSSEGTRRLSVPFAGLTSWPDCWVTRSVATCRHAGLVGQRPFLTVRSKIPKVALRADSGTIGKRSLKSALTFDQS